MDYTVISSSSVTLATPSKGYSPLTKQRRLRYGVFQSVIELNRAIYDHLNAHNVSPKPSRWTAPADTIIGKHQLWKRPLESLH